MDLDALLHHYFGTSAVETLDDEAIEAGVDRAVIAFGTERDSGRRFALWALLHALGRAPDTQVAFKSPSERQAAEMYARAAAYVGRPPEDD